MQCIRTFLILVLLLVAQNFVVKGQYSNSVDSQKNTDPSEIKSDDIDANATKKTFRLFRGTREFEVATAFAPTQPTFFSGNKEYITDGRKLGMLNLRWTRTIGTVKNITYQHYFELTPLAVALNNEAKNPDFISKQETPQVPEKIKRTAYGVGVQPINFRIIFKPNGRIKPFVNAGAGMIFFNRKMPVSESTFYNFTGDFGGGVRYTLDRERQNKALILGYRYFHISNFNTTKINPGYNANIFYLGYSFSRR